MSCVHHKGMILCASDEFFDEIYKHSIIEKLCESNFSIKEMNNPPEELLPKIDKRPYFRKFEKRTF